MLLMVFTQQKFKHVHRRVKRGQSVVRPGSDSVTVDVDDVSPSEGPYV